MRTLIGAVGAEADPIDLEVAYDSGSPWLRANFIAGLDGAIEIDGKSGGLGGPADTRVFVALRTLTDAVLVGAGTARAERYGPAWLDAAARARRLGRSQPELPVVAVVTSSADLDPASRLFAERRNDQPIPPRTLVLTAAAAPADRLAALREVATVIICGEKAVDLVAAVAGLRALGHGRILCEGGPALMGELMAAGLLDELCLTHAPVIGGQGRRTLGQGAGLGRFALAQLLEEDGLLFGRYRTLGPDGGTDAA
jgi:riboflavin biosynthesis pyrimidine reductase